MGASWQMTWTVILHSRPPSINWTAQSNQRMPSRFHTIRQILQIFKIPIWDLSGHCCWSFWWQPTFSTKKTQVVNLCALVSDTNNITANSHHTYQYTKQKVQQKSSLRVYIPGQTKKLTNKQYDGRRTFWYRCQTETETRDNKGAKGCHTGKRSVSQFVTCPVETYAFSWLVLSH